MSNPNVTSSPSLSTRISVWLSNIPLITRCVMILCTSIYLLELLFGSVTGTVCLVPFLIIEKSSFYRLLTPVWFHGGILHIILNMMAFQPLATTMERNSLGSLMFAYFIFLFDAMCGLIHTFMAAFLYYSPFKYPSFMFQCNIGFSSILFGMLTVNVNQNPNGSRSIFGMINVPSKIYPWVLLLVLQLIMPNISFLGHLSGIIVGYAYSYGYLRFFIPSSALLTKIESSNVLGWLVARDGYITNPYLGSLPTTNPSRGNSQNGGGIMSSLGSYFNSSSSRSSNQLFSGTGQVLGSGSPSARTSPTIADLPPKPT